MDVETAYRLVAGAIDSGRTANGYLVVGDLKQSAAEVVDRILQKLFPGEAKRIAAREHPDVIYLNPQGRSRTIKVERGKDDDGPGMRDGFLEPLATTAFAGGWKVGVIVGADRMQIAAANAFLKMLEEPPSKTLFLLMTDRPDSILPTILSRTQRIDLGLPDGLLADEYYDQVAEVFASTGVDGVFAKAQAARRLVAILDEVKSAAEDAEVALERKSFFLTVMSFVRRWMTEGRLPRHLAFRNIDAVEDAYRQSERFLPDEMVLSSMLDRMTFPK